MKIIESYTQIVYQYEEVKGDFLTKWCSNAFVLLAFLQVNAKYRKKFNFLKTKLCVFQKFLMSTVNLPKIAYKYKCPKLSKKFLKLPEILITYYVLKTFEKPI